MLTWFQNLSKREQFIILGGGAFLILLIFYYAIWSPLSDAANDAKKKYQEDVSLLEYLHQTVPVIVAHKGQISTPSNSTEPLLTRIEKSINTTKLISYLSNIQQQGKSINMAFDSVPFDTLMSWLQTFSKTNKMKIDSMNVSRLTTPGLATIQLTIQ